MTQANRFVFAGGGTGGHLYPALAVTEALRKLNARNDITFYCTPRPIDGKVLGQAGVEAVPQSVRPLPRLPWQVPGFLYHWRKSVRVCKSAFAERRPVAVLGAGGYASGPPVHAAMKLGIPTFILNPDAVPGRANRHLASKSGLHAVFAQWEVSREYFPPDAPVEVVGCPVRPEFRKKVDRIEVLRSFGLLADKPTLLVTGASQGARTINEALLVVAKKIADAGWQILHLSGPANQDDVKKTYHYVRDKEKNDFSFVVLPYTSRMPEAMASVDMIISRAGASTLAEIQVAGLPGILLPYPYHRDQHQRHNARVLADAGAAVLMDDARDGTANAQTLSPILDELLHDKQKRDKMSIAARKLAHPDAAETIAGYLAGQGSGNEAEAIQ
jgi:UDP-N-acetylglucosamine--N-acetylmuramyl-(pentapeptide) pyrophosphoryl-undecaprenol N-acetylglucosamine transferase